MTPCQEVRRLILEGEPHELRGIGDSPLAAHVRACPRCARVATTVLAETERLDAYLTRDPTEARVDAILDRAGWIDPSPSGVADGPASDAAARRWRPRWAWLAAAAAVGALLLLPGRSVRPGPELPAVAGSRPPTVEAMSGQRVAVLETENPDITVLWFF